MQYGHHIVTALAIRAFQTYPLAGREMELEARINRGLNFLRNNLPYNHTDRAFTLMGLVWGGAPASEIQAMVASIESHQDADGGWAQRAHIESDAWATGIALYSLHTAGMRPTNRVYQRGMQYLLNTQFEDGSWYVQSRTLAIQPHFDSQFPHGKDQWISMAATAFASASLGLALEPKPIDTNPLLVGFGNSKKSLHAEPTDTEKPFEFAGERTISFVEQIQPILEDKCIDCHGAVGAKGKLSLATRDGFLEGGESGLKLIQLGDGAASQIIRHVTDKVEDMEMPPLDRRDNYNKLTEQEIFDLTNWITEGANWPQGLVLDE